MLTGLTPDIAAGTNLLLESAEAQRVWSQLRERSQAWIDVETAVGAIRAGISTADGCGRVTVRTT